MNEYPALKFARYKLVFQNFVVLTSYVRRPGIGASNPAGFGNESAETGNGPADCIGCVGHKIQAP